MPRWASLAEGASLLSPLSLKMAFSAVRSFLAVSQVARLVSPSRTGSLSQSVQLTGECTQRGRSFIEFMLEQPLSSGTRRPFRCGPLVVRTGTHIEGASAGREGGAGHSVRVLGVRREDHSGEMTSVSRVGGEEQRGRQGKGAALPWDGAARGCWDREGVAGQGSVVGGGVYHRVGRGEMSDGVGGGGVPWPIGVHGGRRGWTGPVQASNAPLGVPAQPHYGQGTLTGFAHAQEMLPLVFLSLRDTFPFKGYTPGVPTLPNRPLSQRVPQTLPLSPTQALPGMPWVCLSAACACGCSRPWCLIPAFPHPSTASHRGFLGRALPPTAHPHPPMPASARVGLSPQPALEGVSLNISRPYYRPLSTSAGAEVSMEWPEGDDAGIAVLSLNRGHAKNAIGRQLLTQLRCALHSVLSHPAQPLPHPPRVLIIRSSVPHVFSAGADLKERRGMSAKEAADFVDTLRATFSLLERLPLPSIAAVEGVALGGGLELALACDLRVCGESSELALPETGLAIIPGAGGTQRLPRLVGRAKAKELIFTGRRVGAEEAKSLGLVNSVVPDGTVLDHAFALARQMLPKGPLALASAKYAVDRGMELELSAGLAVERGKYLEVLQSEDRLEGLIAFAEKRKPLYRGR